MVETSNTFQYVTNSRDPLNNHRWLDPFFSYPCRRKCLPTSCNGCYDNKLRTKGLHSAQQWHWECLPVPAGPSRRHGASPLACVHSVQMGSVWSDPKLWYDSLTHACTHTHIYIYIFTHKHIQTYKHTQAHTHNQKVCTPISYLENLTECTRRTDESRDR